MPKDDYIVFPLPGGDYYLLEPRNFKHEPQQSRRRMMDSEVDQLISALQEAKLTAKRRGKAGFYANAKFSDEVLGLRPQLLAVLSDCCNVPAVSAGRHDLDEPTKKVYLLQELDERTKTRQTALVYADKRWGTDKMRPPHTRLSPFHRYILCSKCGTLLHDPALPIKEVKTPDTVIPIR